MPLPRSVPLFKVREPIDQEIAIYENLRRVGEGICLRGHADDREELGMLVVG